MPITLKTIKLEISIQRIKVLLHVYSVFFLKFSFLSLKKKKKKKAYTVADIMQIHLISIDILALLNLDGEVLLNDN
jgi:hypothetical protein